MKTHRELTEEKEKRQENMCFLPLKRIFELEKMEREATQRAEYAAIFKPKNEKMHRDFAKFARVQKILLIEIALRKQKKILKRPKSGKC